VAALKVDPLITDDELSIRRRNGVEYGVAERDGVGAVGGMP
jgi:hypothetical protein